MWGELAFVRVVSRSSWPEIWVGWNPFWHILYPFLICWNSVNWRVCRIGQSACAVQALSRPRIMLPFLSHKNSWSGLRGFSAVLKKPMSRDKFTEGWEWTAFFFFYRNRKTKTKKLCAHFRPPNYLSEIIEEKEEEKRVRSQDLCRAPKWFVFLCRFQFKKKKKKLVHSFVKATKVPILYFGWKSSMNRMD